MSQLAPGLLRLSLPFELSGDKTFWLSLHEVLSRVQCLTHAAVAFCGAHSAAEQLQEENFKIPTSVTHAYFRDSIRSSFLRDTFRFLFWTPDNFTTIFRS